MLLEQQHSRNVPKQPRRLELEATLTFTGGLVRLAGRQALGCWIRATCWGGAVLAGCWITFTGWLASDLDHTADVQIHSWGENLKETFEQAAVAMFNYMTTDMSRVDMTRVHTVTAEGDDMINLLYHFLDEFLFLFSVEPFIICKVVKIVEFDTENFKITAEGYGETFDISKHPQGTEVKAITYSNMQIHDKNSETFTAQSQVQAEGVPEKSDLCHLFVIIDI